MPTITNGEPEGPPMNKFTGETFSDETMVLDFTHFEDCIFKQCRMIFHGQGPIGLVDCEFDNCKWRFGGSAAQTLGFMVTMYHHSPESRKIIKQTFENIRRGDVG